MLKYIMLFLMPGFLYAVDCGDGYELESEK